MSASPRIGVLALQGGFAAHLASLKAAGLAGEEVRRASQLEGLDGLILPGGESTTHLRLMEERGLDRGLKEFSRRGGALFGTCAGAILLARKVTGPGQPSLGLMDMEIRRNDYGRQVDSFETACRAEILGPGPLPLVFIRAPRIVAVGSGVEVLLRVGGDPVLVRQGRLLAATFHPELTADLRIHRHFAQMVPGAALSAS